MFDRLARRFLWDGQQRGGSDCSLVAFITAFWIRPLLRLSKRAGRQHAKSNRRTRGKRDVHDTARAFTGHKIKVRRLAADHDAEGNDPIEAFAGD